MQLLLHCLQLPDHEAMPEERVVQTAPSSIWEYLKKAPETQRYLQVPERDYGVPIRDYEGLVGETAI